MGLVLLDKFGAMARQHHLLTASEEIELARKIQRGMQDGATRKEQRIGRRAKDRMIQANYGLVMKNAAKFNPRIRGTAIDVEDLCQAAIIGLNRACELFDPERGYKFSTYATLWIQQAMRREIDAHRTAIKIPNGGLTISRRWKYKPQDQNKSQDQTLEEFCEQYGYKPERVLDELELTRRAHCASLDKVTEEGSALSELIADERLHDLESSDYVDAWEQLRGDEVTKAAASLIELEATGANSAVIAETIGVPRQAVKGRLKDAKAVLREHLPGEIHDRIVGVNSQNRNTAKSSRMTVAPAPAMNGHEKLDELVDEIQSEAAPPAKPKRTRRTRAQIEAAAKLEKQPALISVIADGIQLEGTPEVISRLVLAMRDAKQAVA